MKKETKTKKTYDFYMIQYYMIKECCHLRGISLKHINGMT